MEALKTLNGSRIWYSKYSVGKQMASQIYVHKNYATDIIPADTYNESQTYLPRGFTFNCVMYDTKKPNVIRFDACPGFDNEREPVAGWQCTIDMGNKKAKKKYCSQVFHHKWLWVKDDYNGFDVEESYKWSKEWLKYITHPSGHLNKWNEELRKNDLIIDKED